MNIFNTVRLKKPRKNSFNLSHDVKMTAKMGKLTPILCQEVIPGDKFNISTEMYIKLQPLVAPILEKVNVFTHFFFVPNRLIWKEWEDFITGGVDGTLAPVHPYTTAKDLYASGIRHNPNFKGSKSLAAYLGVASSCINENSGDIRINELPFRAYNQIFNDYYIDQNLQHLHEFEKGSGKQAQTDDFFDLKTRNYEKDYFTASLPFIQRGAEVTASVGLKAPLKFNNFQIFNKNIDESYPPFNTSVQATKATSEQFPGRLYVGDDADKNDKFTLPDGAGYADLSEASGLSINELRRATSLQRWLEKNARGGSRYFEQILQHFGVQSPDARLQRAEYLGGARNPVQISEVLQTSSTDETSPQGNFAGHGTSVGKTQVINKFVQEHGFIIGIMSVMPRTSYATHTPRHFFKNDKFDYFFPDFANLGEQPVFNKEIFIGNDTTEADKTFGYLPRYTEYRYNTSRVVGDMSGNLSFWHLARQFDKLPTLSPEFIKYNRDKRIFAVTDEEEDELIIQIYNEVKAVRPIPTFGTPTL